MAPASRRDERQGQAQASQQQHTEMRGLQTGSIKKTWAEHGPDWDSSMAAEAASKLSLWAAALCKSRAADAPPDARGIVLNIMWLRCIVAKECGREQDALGDHRSACPRSGVLRARGGPLERAPARICREAGAVVAMHTLVRDLDVGSVPGDDRRIEVIANGLPLWGGMQLAVDTTLVSALSGASARKPWTSCSGWRGNVREVCRLVCAALCRLPLPGAGPPSWPRARAGRTLPASWPRPPTRPQVSMGRRPWSVTCLLTAGNRLARVGASGEGRPAREELTSVNTAAKTSRARRRPLKSPLKHVEATAEKGARAS